MINSITVPQSVGGKQEFVVGTVSGCVVDGATNNPTGSICKVSVTFTPAYAGVRSQPLVIDLSATFGDAPGTDYAVIGLSGTGLAPLAVAAPGTATLLQAGLATPSYQYLFASCMAVDGAGNAYTPIPLSGTVVEIDKDTTALSTVVGSLSSPQAVAVDPVGTVFIAYANVVIKVRSQDGSNVVVNEEDGYGGNYGFSGDGGPAYLASLESPQGLAIDPAGNLYVADTGNQRIRRVDANTQIITTYAGGGSILGDGGAATSATLSSPAGLATDSAGNLYIADSGNNRIRKITASTGVITTVAGNGTAGYTGDGGQATAAELSGPLALSLDAAGNLYITDSGNNVVRKVDSATNTIYTIAGGGKTTLTAAGQTQGATGTIFARPSGVAIDPLGSLLVSSSANSQIFKIAPAAGAIIFPQQTLVNSPDTADDPEKFYLSNDGTQPFSISVPSSGTNPALPTGFSIDNASACQALLPGATALTLAAGSTCAYGVDFTPATTGTVTGTLTVTDTAPGGTQTMALSGTGGTASATTTSLAFSYTPPGYGYPSYTSSDTLVATVAHASVGATSPINGTVTFYSDGTALAGGSNVAVTNGAATFNFTQLLEPGTHTLTATFTPGTSSNLDASTTASGLSVTVVKATPTIASLIIDNHIYDGNPHGVSITTTPSNLPVTYSYNLYGSFNGTTTPPTLPGVYVAAIYINTPEYSFSTTVLLHIYPLAATVTVGNLSVPYGSPVPAPTVTTTPAGLATTVYYNGSTTPPTAIGQYLVAAVVTATGYAGVGDATLQIYSPTLATSTWIVNQDSTVSHLGSSGSVLSTAGTANGTSTLGGIAIDGSGDAWAVTNANNSVVEVSPSGTLLGTYTGGGLLSPVSVAIDGLGKPWVVNSGNSLTVLSTSGNAVSPSTGYLATSLAETTPLSTPTGIAIDATGSVWITNSGDASVTRVFGAAAPVITPASAAVAGSLLGVRP
jgi:sugar lactone lactonase YvrE